jgi:hypothetical protein
MGARRDRFFWHPVCERDWEVKEDYRGAFPAMLVGRNAPGTPVHAVGAGTIRPIAMGGGPGISNTGLLLNGKMYQNCVYIDHGQYLYDDATNMQATSIYCNIDGLRSSRPVTVKRGEIIGHTSSAEAGNAIVALQLGGILVDPEPYYGAYPDCHFPHIVVERLPTCDGGNGNGTFIHPKYNVDLPGVPTVEFSWDVLEYVGRLVGAALKFLSKLTAWIVGQMYDYLIYPVLCGLVSVYNSWAGSFEDFANSGIDLVDTVAVFIYRLWMVAKHILMRLGELFTGIMTAIFSYADGTLCIKNVMIYFVQALYYSAMASADISGDLNANSGFALGLAIINSTVASTFMLPMTMLLIAWLGRKLVVWTINKFARTFRSGTGEK